MFDFQIQNFWLIIYLLLLTTTKKAWRRIMTLAKVYTDEEKYEVNISVPHSKNTSKEIFINSIIKSGLIIDKKDKKI